MSDENQEITTKDWGPFWSAVTTIHGNVRVEYGKTKEIAECNLIYSLRKAARRPKPKPKPTTSPEKPAKVGAKQLAKRIAEGAPDLAIEMLKKQREGEEDWGRT